MILCDFTKGSVLTDWRVINDVVMGGRSKGRLRINAEGHAEFIGTISLENNGGFSSIRCQFDKKDIADFQKISIRLKGDGKAYQFRVKSKKTDRHNYIFPFETSGEWQIIDIQLNKMIPSFRGRKLDMPNYSGEKLEEIAFLIGNKKTESFKIEIDKIILK